MNKTVIIAIVVGIIVFIGGFIFIRNSIRSIRSSVSVPSNVTPGETQPSGEWKEFDSSVFDYTIRYPANGNIDNPTSDGSEVLTVPARNKDDGVKLTFRSGYYNEDDFLDFVYSKLEELENESIVNFSSDSRSVDLAGLSGYEFDVTVNETITYTFLQKGRNEYFQIINETKDPNNNDYVNLANEILNTLKVDITLPT